MKLYYSGVSSRSRRVRALIADLDLDVEEVAVDLGAGAQRQPEFLTMNPNGLVPVLVEGDVILWESAAIMQYLASLKPTSLYPADLQVRADIAHFAVEEKGLQVRGSMGQTAGLEVRPEEARNQVRQLL